MLCNKPKPWDGTEENVVVCHQLAPAKTIPSQSPFVMKLNTYLSIAGIKYVKDYTKPFGPKGKTPWITLNKKDMGDSQLIIEHLNQHFNVDMDSHLNPERKGVLDAARCMVENHLMWIFVVWRLYHTKGEYILRTGGPDSKIQRFLVRYLLPIIIKIRAGMQGVGAHTETEQFSMAKQCIESLVAILGDRKYFGGEKPCIADCSIFGHLSQYYWTEPGTKYEKLVKEDFPSLGNYCVAMKERVFPDWDTLLST